MSGEPKRGGWKQARRTITLTREDGGDDDTSPATDEHDTHARTDARTHATNLDSIKRYLENLFSRGHPTAPQVVPWSPRSATANTR